MMVAVKQSLRQGMTWFVGASLVVAIGIGTWVLYGRLKGQSSGNITAEVITVQKGTVEEVVSESGILELESQQQLKAAVQDAGVVEQVLVQVGDRVRVGQPLVILRSPEQQTKLAEHELDIQRQQAEVRTKQQQITDKRLELLDRAADKALGVQRQELELTNKRNDVIRSQEKLAEAEQKFRQYQQAFDRGFISADELAAKRDELRNARLALEQAESTVILAELDLNRAVAQSEQAQQTVTTGTLEAEQALRSALRDLEKLELQRGKIERELETNAVTAPSTGIVLDVQARRGDVVNAEKVLLTIGNPIQEVIKLQLSPINARKVKAGQPVRIQEVAADAQTYRGQVKSVARIATDSDSSASSRDSSDSGQATLSATVRLDTPSRKLIPGIRVNVDIIVAQRNHAIALPPSVIQRDAGKSFVWILDSQQRAQKRTIVLGIDAITTVEVISGLKPGEKVIQPSLDSPIIPGSRIRRSQKS
jgi:HlyD family secretion protein